MCFFENVSQFTWARLAALVGGATIAGMLSIDAVRAPHVCSGFMVMTFFGDMKKMPCALCFGDIDFNLICLEVLEGEISNLVAWKVRRLLQAGFHLHNIKRGLMLMREISWSTLPVEQAHGSTGSIHKLHPMMGSEVISRRSMLHMSRALFFPERSSSDCDENGHGRCRGGKRTFVR